MRISSSILFDSNVAALNQQQAKLFQTQQQIATGRRMLSASDDPVAAAQALDVSQADAMNTQYASNRNSASSTLTMADGAMQSVASLIQDVRDTAISAGASSVTDSARKTIAADFSGKLQALVGLANSTDGTGNYLFAGFQTKSQPFLDTTAGVAYFGDDGQRNIQVSAARQMAASDPGTDIFMRIKSGNGTFVTQAGAANTGSGLVSQGSVLDPTLLTGDNYSIAFNVAGGVTTYDVTDTTNNAVISVGTPYVSGQAISFDGMKLDVKGAPANGDTFAVAPSTNESVFKTIADLISVLNTPAVGANLANGLSHGLSALDNVLNHVSNVRASLGLRLNEIDSLQTMGEDKGLQLKKTLSQLQDVDYNKAASDLAQQNTVLQAAQQSFAKVSALSLFSYL